MCHKGMYDIGREDWEVKVAARHSGIWESATFVNVLAGKIGKLRFQFMLACNYSL